MNVYRIYLRDLSGCGSSIYLWIVAKDMISAVKVAETKVEVGYTLDDVSVMGPVIIHVD